MKFQIFDVPAPPGVIGLCPLPGRFSPLAADLTAIHVWGPSIVASLTETGEMARHHAEALGAQLAEGRIAWAHLPVRDYGVPAMESGAAWPALAARLHGVLDKGGRVLLHCFGGQGRSGMIALRLLAERGEAPQAALTRLRAVRPGAV
jgi:protein-tyrosine phosphatase